jgi:hypothetical protein
MPTRSVSLAGMRRVRVMVRVLGCGRRWGAIRRRTASSSQGSRNDRCIQMPHRVLTF